MDFELNLKNSFFPSTIIEVNNIDSNKKNSEILALFKQRILVFNRSSTIGTFHRHKPTGLKPITKLRLKLCLL